MPDKPLPWYCSHCKTATVNLRRQPYEFDQLHDGRLVRIRIADLLTPVCETCERITLAHSTLECIALETYRQLGLLTPDEIRANRERLGLTQQQMQAQLGLGGNSMSRWEKGHIYQSRALDRFMRVFFASEQVRQMLATDDWALPQAPVELSYSERFLHAPEACQPKKPTIRPSEVLAAVGDASA